MHVYDTTPTFDFNLTQFLRQSLGSSNPPRRIRRKRIADQPAGDFAQFFCLCLFVGPGRSSGRRLPEQSRHAVGDCPPATASEWFLPIQPVLLPRASGGYGPHGAGSILADRATEMKVLLRADRPGAVHRQQA